jgi:hypothetical protein
MGTPTGTIEFVHEGIGKSLANRRLKVPVNQREYSWEDEQVKELFDDFQRTLNKGSYFLGTIVLTRSSDGALEVADGQQRLATSTILISACRDWFFKQGDTINVDSIEQEFLMVIDRIARKRIPRLSLNVDDNEFFRQKIICRPGDNERTVSPSRESHKKIERAQHLAAKHIQNLTRGKSQKTQTETLLHWVDFIGNGAQVILLMVPDHLNAFRMFETLNDRGLKTSQADLLKNYLLGESGTRIEEAQHKWSSMTGTLESAGIDDIVLTYLRHLLVAKHGATRERDVYDRIKVTVQGSFPAIEFLDDLSDNANTYVAMLNHQHHLWGQYGQYSTKVRRHLETLNELRAEQIRPLVLACIKSFSHKELELTLRFFISLVVRFMISGTPNGTVEKYYASKATGVWSHEIKSTKALFESLQKNIPTDEVFKAAFANCKLSKSHLARYFLRAIEQKIKRDPEPEHVVNDDSTIITLEHILPENPEGKWNVGKTVAESIFRRLGNMVLLRASVNSTVGNSSFADKKKVYKQSSTMELTKWVVACDDWTEIEVAKRQAEMAELAVKIWPFDYK